MITSVLVFMSIETLLALSGVRSPAERRDPYVGFCATSKLFGRTQKDGQAFYETAPAKLQYFNRQTFPQTKPSGTRRVFCLGGSTTFGRPYDDRTSYVNWLRESLSQLSLTVDGDPSVNWEVINAGGISYASYRLLNLAEEIIHYDPDFVIIHTGHNEFLEKRTYPSSMAGSTVVTQGGAWLSHSRIVGVFDSLVNRNSLFPSGPASPSIDLTTLNVTSGLKHEVDAILDNSVGPDAYHLESLQVDQVVSHFEHNLIGIIKLAQSAGSEVLLVTPVSNLKDFSPFKSQYFSTLDAGEQDRWMESYMSALDAYQNGEMELSMKSLQICEAIDSQRADLQYLKGKIHFANGDFVASKRCFESAIDLDVCPLRATGMLKGLTRKVATEFDVPLVDLSKRLESHCEVTYGHTILGDNYFLDHVHPTVSTHGLIAEAVLKTMRTTGALGFSDKELNEVLDRVAGRVDRIIDQELQSRALTNLAQVLSWAGKQTEAALLALKAIEIQTELGAYDPDALFYAATQYGAVGQDEVAIKLLEQVLVIDSGYHPARWRLAALLYDQENYVRSCEHYRIAVEEKPDDLSLRRQLGFALLRSGAIEEAKLVFNEYLSSEPGDTAVINQLKRLQDSATNPVGPTRP